ncbi:hypothetical protein LTR37_000141 [Vermiconidia calcicola]|uniref:Uncharacterized protein n=1 Tax=Vermiconidia calcicola TaxID=1690605 RepID=A0ACC3NZI5_9PEZI|nr:hypothetical protein LTR37_000141 [Vermiconidia calcicola]
MNEQQRTMFKTMIAALQANQYMQRNQGQQTPTPDHPSSSGERARNRPDQSPVMIGEQDLRSITRVSPSDRHPEVRCTFIELIRTNRVDKAAIDAPAPSGNLREGFEATKEIVGAFAPMRSLLERPRAPQRITNLRI